MARSKKNQLVLERLRERYEAGDKDALLHALHWCLAFDQAPPAWVSHNVTAALMRFWKYQAATLDDAFGVKHRIIKE